MGYVLQRMADDFTDDQTILGQLDARLGRVHARQRLGIERDHEQRVFGGGGRNFFHIENWYAARSIIRNGLKLCGLYHRARRNAADIQVRENSVAIRRLPTAFEGFTILHMSDLHVDMSVDAMERLVELVGALNYDICVMTGDYRGETFGPFGATLDGLRRICDRLTGPAYGVLGNHDTVLMLPGMEAMGIKVLMNEVEVIDRSGERLHLAGVDDPHFYRVDNIQKVAQDIPDDAPSILLSHTAEIHRQAAHAGFDLMLVGHTHGGQLCLPGGIPVILDSAQSRRFTAGPWRYNDMAGYTNVGAGTSIQPVRLNCLPEVTLHELRRA
jgi:predicted MPP superfamily phosphohydrolase